MNIMTVIILLALLEDQPELPKYSRADRRAARENAIRRNRKIYHNRIGFGIWYENADENGTFVSYHRSKVITKPQEGRWATNRLSGHRRLQKWSRDYYRSGADEKAIRRWNDAVVDYFDQDKIDMLPFYRSFDAVSVECYDGVEDVLEELAEKAGVSKAQLKEYGAFRCEVYGVVHDTGFEVSVEPGTPNWTEFTVQYAQHLKAAKERWAYAENCYH